MSSTHAVRDSTTMLRRNLLRLRRYPSLTIMLVAQPLLFLVLFVYVFGGTMGGGLRGADAGSARTDYLTFITPGILVMSVAGVSIATAIAIAMVRTGGIIDRFRTLDIARSSVLTGHVLASMVQQVVTLAVVVAVAVLLGFRSAAGPLDWLGVLGLLALLALGLTWVAAAMGLASPNVETASNWPMIFTLLPFIGSGFVPVDTMPRWLRPVAEHQPFTPVMDTVRGLLQGGADGSTAVLAVGWCVAIAVAGFWWSRRLFGKVRAA